MTPHSSRSRRVAKKTQEHARYLPPTAFGYVSQARALPGVFALIVALDTDRD